MMSDATEQDEVEPQPKPEPSLETPAEEAILREAEAETEAKANAGSPRKERNVDALFNVKLNVRVVLGHTRMPVSDLLQLTRGSVIELDRRVGDPVDIMVNDRLIARGDLVKIKGNMLGVALREIVKDFVTSD